ncbi:MAG: hypothetical protein IPM53_06735 [Anaerolineaceae bacterium]|nr:hypothetical protein [Anaerolineaceae bacterium]
MFNISSQFRRQTSYGLDFWLRPLLIGGVLLGSAVLSFFVSYQNLMLVLVLFVAIATVSITIRRPGLGLIGILLSSMIVPFSGPSGLNPTMGLIALLTLLWIIGMIVRDREIRLVTSRTTRPLLIMLVGACLSFLVGQLRWFDPLAPAPLGAQLGALSIFVLAALAFFLGANQIHDLRWLRWMVWAFLATATFFLLVRLSPFGIPNLFLRGGEYRGVLMIWFGCLAFAMAYFNKDLSLRWRLALGVLTLVIVYYNFVVKYAEKSGWLALLISLAIIWGVQSWRNFLILAFLGTFPAIYLVTDAIATDEYSYLTRIDALVIILEMIKTNPILGLGPANYRWYTPLFAIRGFDVAFNSHNNYADIAAQTGFLGMLSFIWIFIEVGWLGLKLRYRVAGGFAQAFVFASIGATVGTVILAAMADWVIPFFYNLGMLGFRSAAVGWLFSGALVSVGRLALKPETK